jgi:hypothetical protein
MCTAVLIGRDPATPPLPPRIWAHTRALLRGQDRRHLFVTPRVHAYPQQAGTKIPSSLNVRKKVAKASLMYSLWYVG